MLPPDPFYNRETELLALDRGWRHPLRGGRMALLHGRRRVGKTFLLQRFVTIAATSSEPVDAGTRREAAAGFTEKAAASSGSSAVMPTAHVAGYCYFLADQTSEALQRIQLAERLIEALPSEGTAASEIAVSWNSLLNFVSRSLRGWARIDKGRFILILDEFPYLVDQSPQLPSILQAWWDREGAQSPVYLVLCGSRFSTMSALGRESAPLYGRFNAGIFLLDPLRYDDTAAFYAGSPHYGLEQKLTMYGILGGTPRYHALIDPSRPMAEEVCAVMLNPGSPLENEPQFLIASEQIRDPAPYNAVLNALGSGETRFNRIQQLTGTEKSSLAFHLKTLRELLWVRKELPFGETSERRALYRISDPFLLFHHRFVARHLSEIRFTDPGTVYRSRIEPYLSDYMGRFIFEEICSQWLEKHAWERWGIGIRRLARYWSRDGRIEIDLMAELVDGGYLFGECQWSGNRPIGIDALVGLKAKAAALPEPAWTDAPRFVLFSVGGFRPELKALASDPAERLYLIGGSGAGF